MTDKIGKQYIIERIEARKGRISLERGQLASLLEKQQNELSERLDALFEKNTEKIAAAWDAAKAAKRAYAAASTFPEKMKITESLRLPSLDSVWDIRNASRRSTHPQKDLTTQITELDREKESLEHALIYLKDLPADEFTLAGLRSLGLLSVLKFNLADGGKK